MKKILLLLCLYACSDSRNARNQVDATQVARMLQTDSTVQLVDLRTPDELQETGRIEGAMTIDFKNEDFETRLAELNREEPVIVYCGSGGRSTKATRKMEEMGFKKVWNYKGGMKDWLKKGNKTVR